MVPRGLSHSKKQGKTDENSFSPGKQHFLKSFFLTTSQVPRKEIMTRTIFVRRPFGLL